MRDTSIFLHTQRPEAPWSSSHSYEVVGLASSPESLDPRLFFTVLYTLFCEGNDQVQILQESIV